MDNDQTNHSSANGMPAVMPQPVPMSAAPYAGPADGPASGLPSLQNQISSLPPEANDIDLIEKEWVTHLKYILSQTAGNPYLQQLEISKAKADYMRKRYNKDIKLAEG